MPQSSTPKTPSTKAVLAVLVVLDTAAKAVALADLAKRDSSQVKGSKPLWALALTVVNSLGLLPAVYFAKGRLPKETKVEIIEP